jgi:phage terminase large subunit
MNVELELPPKLVDLFDGEADVRACFGGRGSAKTRTFAKMSAVRGLMWSQSGREGVILCGRQFMNTLDDSSLEEVKAAIQSEPWLLAHYEIGEKYIRTKDGRVSYKFTGLERNINSVKSKARILLCWVDEAEPVTEQAWQVLIPTLREEDSELWVTWNPARKNSATHKRFRENTNDRMKVVELNWRDNPWFPAILDRKRLQDKIERPDSYDHIWEGDFISVVEGAYYASHITEARAENRITKVAKDPTIQFKAFWDIGVRDACAIWIAQFVGREIRVLKYYESVGQPLSAHLEWLRSNGYGKAQCVLPHDGAHMDAVTAIRFEDHISAAGFDTETIPNQGKGAAMKRIEATRRLFPRIWFDEEGCKGGIDALGWYHEKRDEERGIGLGPEHDWASHGADAFGLMCVAYDEPYVQPTRSRYAGRGSSSASWMGS